jgi:hypothetical protein
LRPETLDRIVLILAIVLPVWIVIRSDRRGIYLGAFVVWALGILGGMALTGIVDRDFNLDGLWALVGWIPALIFCSLIYACKRGLQIGWRALSKLRR